jgi:hypothetical protein
MGNALELYFVNTLDGTDVAGLCWPDGIVIAANGDGHTIAHEVLHDCGPEDIYTVDDQNAENPNPIPGLVSRTRLPSDWGGGYYPPDLTQRALAGRLIMRSGGTEEDPDPLWRRDLPSGTVYGWRHSIPADPASPKTLGQAGVGQSAVQNNPGSF